MQPLERAEELGRDKAPQFTAGGRKGATGGIGLITVDGAVHAVVATIEQHHIGRTGGCGLRSGSAAAGSGISKRGGRGDRYRAGIAVGKRDICQGTHCSDLRNIRRRSCRGAGSTGISGVGDGYRRAAIVDGDRARVQHVAMQRGANGDAAARAEFIPAAVLAAHPVDQVGRSQAAAQNRAAGCRCCRSRGDRISEGVGAGNGGGERAVVLRLGGARNADRGSAGQAMSICCGCGDGGSSCVNP